MEFWSLLWVASCHGGSYWSQGLDEQSQVPEMTCSGFQPWTHQNVQKDLSPCYWETGVQE